MYLVQYILSMRHVEQCAADFWDRGLPGATCLGHPQGGAPPPFTNTLNEVLLHH